MRGHVYIAYCYVEGRESVTELECRFNNIVRLLRVFFVAVGYETQMAVYISVGNLESHINRRPLPYKPVCFCLFVQHETVGKWVHVSESDQEPLPHVPANLTAGCSEMKV
jgi:hypothetical protein